MTLKTGPHATVSERKQLMEILAANDFGPCTHPDCDLRHPSCANNYIFERAWKAVKLAYKAGIANGKRRT